MTLLVQPRLINEPFSDPGLYLDFRFAGRAILFDLGDLSPLSPRELLRVTHAFVSHNHMDHFAGFDRLLRLFLYRNARLALVGPSGMIDAVEAKLKAYSWNLLGEHSHDFVLEVREWTPRGIGHLAEFAARSAFARADRSPTSASGGVAADDAGFQVEAAELDHGIPCLAFAFQEKLRANVSKPRLDEMGLPVGPWLTEAKQALRAGADPGATFQPVPGRAVSLGELLGAGALRTGRGQRIAYVTDLAYTPSNIASAVRLASGADRLFIESGFLEADRGLASAKRHLTAAQAGRIAAMAGVTRATPMHFSPRYLERRDELVEEFHAACASLSSEVEGEEQAPSGIR